MIAIGVIFVTFIKLPLIFGASSGLTEALDLKTDQMAVETCTDPIEETEFQYTNWDANTIYAVGDTVDIICKPGASSNVGQTSQTVTCLRGDEWSKVIECKTACPNGFTLYGSICYNIGPKVMSFEEAMLHCAKFKPELGSRLLIASTEEKQIDLMSMARDEGYFSTNRKNLWIGATDKLEENTFLWNDGQIMNFLTPEFKFYSGEPNDMVSPVAGNEDCLILWENGALADNFCHVTHYAPSYALCEIPI